MMKAKRGGAVLQVLIGGALIGLASALLMATNGRIAGISSIVHRAFFLRGEESWTVWFVLGLMLGPAVMLVLGWVSPPNIDIDWGSIIVGGFWLVWVPKSAAVAPAAMACAGWAVSRFVRLSLWLCLCLSG